MHIILFPKTKLKRITLIKTIFLKTLQMKIAGFWKSFQFFLHSVFSVAKLELKLSFTNLQASY